MVKKYRTKESRDKALRGWKQERRGEWSKHPGAVRFMEDHVPAEWEVVKRCGQEVALRRDPGAGTWSWTFRPCRRLPWCMHCAEKAKTMRAMKAFEAFERCTPKGEKPRFIHFVTAAPVYAVQEGWGWKASQDVKKYRQVVLGALKDVYGPHVGAYMSYQDFGEQGFAKRHPHIDLTLNGWTLRDGRPVHTPRLDLTRGWAAWDAGLLGRAQVFGANGRPGNTSITAIRVGRKAYQRILKYQVRELVDIRKVEYDRNRRRVWWLSYKDDGPVRTPYTVPEFKAGLAEYAWRLDQWPGDGRRGRELHVPMGHMSKARIAHTEALMRGRRKAHWKGCVCSECNDWVDEEPQAQAWAR